MANRSRTSFELTEVTKKILQELKKARWDNTEVINAGIVAFSQMDDEQQMFFKKIAYGLKSEHSENARNIVRNWLLQLVADAQVHPAKKKLSQRAKPSKAG